MKIKITIIPLIIFVILLFFLFNITLSDRDPSSLPSNLINKKFPQFETSSLLGDNKFVSSNEFSNEVILVNFFATWCKPCLDEHKYISRFAKEKKIKIIGINYKDESKKTIKWLKKFGNPYSNIALDPNGRIAINWGVYGIPETFVVNSKGIIKYRQVGPINKKIYKKINILLNEIE